MAKETMGRAMDIIAKKSESMFMMFFKAGFEPPTNFLSPIDSYLYDDLKRFLLLEPIDEINGMVVMRNFYNQANGNVGRSLVEKTKKFCEDQECQYLTMPVTSLVPNLQ